jgi:hypothetical protein
LSSSRAVDWSRAGVLGGIPSGSWTQCTNSQCQTVTNAGTSATAAQILAALQNAPANTYVLLGPGTYSLTTGICVKGASNVELRGSGANSTFLVFTGAAGCMGGMGSASIGFQSNDTTYPGGVSYTQVAPWNGGAQGATSIVFPNGLGNLSVTPNQTLLMLDECDTGRSGSSTSSGTCLNGSETDNGQYFNCGEVYAINPTTGCGFQGADTFSRHSRGQIEIAQVTSCSPGCNSTGSVTVNLKDPLLHPNWSTSSSPEAWVVQSVQNVGVKDLSIDAAGSQGIEAIGLYNVNNAWVQRVRVNSPYDIGIWLSGVSHASIIDNYIYNVGQNYTYQDNWGIKDGPGEYNLMQNNIIQATRVAIANGEGPAVGDVTAYNFAVNQIDQSDYVWGAYWQHANGDDYDLYEGNVGTYLNEDDVHGTHDFITSFRNMFTGWESCVNGNCGSYPHKDAGTWAMIIAAYNRYANILGNVLGDGIPFQSPSSYQYQFINDEYYSNPNAPYNIGSGNIVNGQSYHIPLDNLTVTSAVRWGNFDLFNNATLFCNGNANPISACIEDERAENAPAYPGLSSPSTTLPASFYLSGKPSWWPNGIAYPAVGPDVTGGNVGQCNGPVDTTGKYNGLLALNSSQCAGSALNAGWGGGHANANPAMACYYNVMGGKPDGVSSVLAFNPTSCYNYSGQSQAATPTFSPADGTYSTAQSVTISDATPGATIYYTTNGTTPTTNSAVYSSPINVSTSETLEAMATASGYTQSATGSASYSISVPQAATPTFSPAGGTYASAQSVTISDSTTGATIYYTTNGTTPTTNSSVYSSPINVSASETLEAMATASGFTQSSTASATYTIGSSGSITLVQEKVLSNGGNQINCNPACPTMTINTTGAGDLLFVSAVSTGNGSGAQTNIASITCSPSCGTWVLPGAACQLYSANTGGVDCGYVLSSTAGATLVNVTMSGNTPYGTFHFREYHTTQAGGFKFDTVATNLSSACTSCATPNLTLTGANDVLIASGAPGGGFTAISSPYGDVMTESYTLTAMGDRLNTSSGTGATITQNANDPAVLYTIAFTDTTPVAATPTFSPAAGTYTSVQSVTISDSTTGATIYYTTDGSTPTTNSSVYSSAINVSASETLKAIATASGYTNSAVGSAAYTINLPQAATPTFSPAAGTYTSVQSVTISDSTTGATIYYTTDGSTPTTGSNVYSSAISVSASETLKAIATASGYTQSAVGSAAYTITPPAATPTFSPAAGTYTSAQSVTISDSTTGATIYYTTDGSTPTTGSSVYSSPISVSASETLKAMATASGYSQSATGSAAYVINLPAATPTFSPAAGTYTSVQSVTISDTTPGATIYYTTNGSTPTTSSSVYSSPISVSSSETLKAMATASGYSQSATGSAAYVINLPAATPTFSPAGGSYTGVQSVAISDSTPGATIYYTTNGSTPTTSSSVYSSPISVAVSETLEAMATASGYTQSATGSASYTITLPAAATPTFSPAGGTYASAQSVTISDATTGATIYYTTDGSTPTTSSSVYSSPITVSSNKTLNAIATASGYAQSPVGSASYTIGTISLVQDKVLSNGGSQINCNPTCPAMTINATGAGDLLFVSAVSTGTGGGVQTNIASITCSPSCGTWVLPGAACQAFSANTGGVDCGYVLSSAAGATTVTVTMSGNTPYGTVHFREYHTTRAAGFSFDKVSTTLSSNCTSCLTPTLTLSENNDVLIASGAPGGGFTGISAPYGDVLTESYTLTAMGDLLNTSSGTGATITQNANDPAVLYTIAFTDTPPVLPAPTFSPAAGTYTTVQSVTISDSTGTTIYYTTDGSTPTISSSVYSSPISVSASETLMAIATESGYTQSAVGSAAYTINLAPAATPTFSPTGGSYTGVQSVIISDSTPGATIYYTTDGSTPTTSSSVYSSPISVSVSETLKAMATASGYTQSAVGSASYTITLVAAATPTFSPAAGTYSTVQSVTISDSTPGATIYYTTNGTTPTTNSSVYSSPISVSSSETLEAMAMASGYTQSPVGSAVYVIKSISLVQKQVLSNSGNQIVCNPTCPAMTINATGAGDLLFISAVATGTGGGAQTNISSITCSPSCGAWVLPGAACQLYSANTGGVDCGYVLSSAAGATSITVTMSGNTPYGTVYFREYHTTATAGFSLDKISTSLSSSCTFCVTPTLTLTGTNDVLIASGAPGGGFTGISTPYGDVQTESYTLTAMGDVLNTSSGTGATITQNANDPAVLYTIAFKD